MRGLYNVAVIALATCVEGIRHKVLWAIVCLAVLLSLANIWITELFSWDLGKVSVEFGLSTVAFTGLLLVFFLGNKMLTDDLEHKRICMTLSRPVGIWQYLMGKFTGLALVLAAATCILGAAATLSLRYVLWRYAQFVPPDFTWLNYFLALGCQWMGLVMVAAVMVLCFSFASSGFVALLLSVCAYLVGQNMDLLRRVVLENPYAGVLSNEERVVVGLSWVFPNLSFFDKKYEAAYGVSIAFGDVLWLSAYCFSYSLLLVYIGAALFRRRELI